MEIMIFIILVMILFPDDPKPTREILSIYRKIKNDSTFQTVHLDNGCIYYVDRKERIYESLEEVCNANRIN